MRKVELFSQKKRNIERELNQVINTIQNIWKERKKKKRIVAVIWPILQYIKKTQYHIKN